MRIVARDSKKRRAAKGVQIHETTSLCAEMKRQASDKAAGNLKGRTR